MTHEQLQILRALCEKATPGPWEYHKSESGDGVLCPRGGYVVEVGHGTTNNDAAFIAAARDALPALLDEVERLRERLDDIQQHAEESEGYWE
jgi:hypothetical protein